MNMKQTCTMTQNFIQIFEGESLRETRPYKSFSGATQIIELSNHWRSKAQIKNRYR